MTSYSRYHSKKKAYCIGNGDKPHYCTYYRKDIAQKQNTAASGYNAVLSRRQNIALNLLKI